MKVEFSNGFTRDIGRIRNQSIRARIEKAIEQIERIDNFTEASNIKKLTLRSASLSCGLLKPVDPRYWGAIEDFLENCVTSVKKLRAGGNHFRIRVGDYRLGLRLENGTVVFTRCLPRRDFYQQFP